MAALPGAPGSLEAAHNTLSTHVAFHVQLPIKGSSSGDGDEGGPTVFNYRSELRRIPPSLPLTD